MPNHPMNTDPLRPFLSGRLSGSLGALWKAT